MVRKYKTKMSKKCSTSKRNRSKKISRRNKKTRKIRGGIQKVYMSIQPSALGIRGEKEWVENKPNEQKFEIVKPIVPKLVSKIFIDNESSVDIDEKLAEIVGSIKYSDSLIKPLYVQMLTSKIE